MGLFVAFLVYLQSLTNVKDARQDLKQGAESAPENPVSKPKFDFYTILPEMEVKVPDWEVDAPPLPAPQSKPQQGPPDTPYLIQVGSFQRFQEADKMKARLALIGIFADIQRVTISG
ncbi:MAG: SPOR domain-containing protein, partial [Gammaproteobacteria bacterium]